MTLTSLGFSSSPLGQCLYSSVWLLPFVTPLDVDASTKKGTMRISEYMLRPWIRTGATLFICIKDFVFYSFFLFISFSYNWPAQNDGVDYGDADEVNNCKAHTAFISHLTRFKANYTNSLLFHRVISATSLPSSFDCWRRKRGKHCLRLTCNKKAPGGKVWGVTWHIFLWCTSKSNQPTCQSNLNIILWHSFIIFYNATDSLIYFCLCWFSLNNFPT